MRTTKKKHTHTSAFLGWRHLIRAAVSGKVIHIQLTGEFEAIVQFRVLHRLVIELEALQVDDEVLGQHFE